jgi:glycosyltransferase involved in cell wall biosynthesis
LKISIITAVFNGEQTIGTTLASIAEQDHPDIEHIVVDGASSDATLAQIRAGDRRGARVVSEPDHGAYDAFNKGLRLATGEVIGFLNCGDSYISPATVSRIAAGFAGSDAQAVFGDVLIVDQRTPGRVLRRYRSHRFTARAMSYGLMPAHPTLFMRREVYRAVGEYNPSFRIAGDFELCVRAFACRDTPYRYLPEPLVRMPTGGLSNRGWRSKWEITGEMMRACRSNGVSTNWLKLCLRFPLKLAELSWFDGAAPGTRDA